MSLQVTQLIGFGVRRTVVANPSITYIGNLHTAGPSVTYTHNAASCGAAGTNRVIVAAAACYTGGNGTLTGVTFDGVAGRINVQATGTTVITSIASIKASDLPDPNVTDVDIIYTYSSSNHYHTVKIYRIVDLTSNVETANCSDTSFSSGLSATMNNNANAIIVASALTIDAPGSADWTSWSSGLTEDDQQYVNSSNTHASASGVFASANTPYTVSTTSSGSISRAAMAAATWSN